MALVELSYLSERARIDTSLAGFRDFQRDHPECAAISMNVEQIKLAFKISDIPELHDRLIAAALESELPVITNDPVIRSSKYVRCVW